MLTRAPSIVMPSFGVFLGLELLERLSWPDGAGLMVATSKGLLGGRRLPEKGACGQDHGCYNAGANGLLLNHMFLLHDTLSTLGLGDTTLER